MWAWIALSVIRAVYNPPGSYWVVINRVMQALFSASVLLLAEKIFLRYVAINFHRRALADRIAENQLGLRALDRLSNATPNPTARRHHPYGQNGFRKGHRNASTAASVSVTLEGLASSSSSSPICEKNEPSPNKNKSRRQKQERRKRSTMAAVIVDGLVKNSKYTREGSTLYSASKLARKLFSTLSDVYPPRDHLVVEGKFSPCNATLYVLISVPNCRFLSLFQVYSRRRQSLFLCKSCLPLIAFSSQQAAFNVFDKDGNGDITKPEMREAVRRIYRERRALTASLKVRLCGIVLTTE